MQLSPEEEQIILDFRALQRQALPGPRELEEISDAEKLAEFDNLYALARDHYEQVKESGYVDEDARHWMFDAVMELLGKQVWQTYN